MRVLMATPSYAPVIGGTETAVRELTRALRKRGHTVDVLTFNMDAKWTPRWAIQVSHEDGGRTLRWGAWNPLQYIRTPRLNRILGKHLDSFVVSRVQHLALVHVLVRRGARQVARGYDVVHCHDESDLSLAATLQPHLMHLHTMSESLPIYRRHKIARHLLTHCARRWVANSIDSAVKGAEVGIPAARMQVIPNGVDVDYFGPAHGSQREGVLFVGRLVPRKGLDLLLEALRRIATPTRLRVVGVPADATYLARIHSLAESIGRTTPHRVELLGPRGAQELRHLYQTSEVVVCPSRIEPFGIVALEAMSCATPVLASRVDGLQEIVGDETSGVLVAPGDLDALASQLGRLLGDAALRQKLGACARESVLHQYTWSRVAEQVEQVYGALT